MRLMNPTPEAINVLVRGEPKDDHAPTACIGPGETKDVDVDENNPTIRGLLFAGALVPVEVGKRKSSHAPAPSQE